MWAPLIPISAMKMKTFIVLSCLIIGGVYTILTFYFVVRFGVPVTPPPPFADDLVRMDTLSFSVTKMGVFGPGDTFNRNRFTGRYGCDTTINNPDVHWVREIAKELYRQPEFMAYTKHRQDGPCVSPISGGNARIWFCGPPGSRLSQNALGYAVDVIAANCMWEGRAGGRFIFDTMLDVVIHVDRVGQHGLKIDFRQLDTAEWWWILKSSSL